MNTFIIVFISLFMFFMLFDVRVHIEKIEGTQNDNSVEYFVYTRVHGIGEKVVENDYQVTEWKPIDLLMDTNTHKIYPAHVCCGQDYFTRLRNNQLDKTFVFECEHCKQKYAVIGENSQKDA